jgi:hypothetical protein
MPLRRPRSSLEEALVHALVEARRAAPAVLYLPHLHLWWSTAPASLRATLVMLLAELPPELPLLLLATADVPPGELEPEARRLFAGHSVLQLGAPSAQQREALFRPLVQAAAQLLPTEEQGQQEQVGVGACVHEVAGSGAREAAWLPAGHGCQQAEARHLASLAGSSRR